MSDDGCSQYRYNLGISIIWKWIERFSLKEDNTWLSYEQGLSLSAVILWPILVYFFNRVQGFPEVDKLALLRIIHHISLIKGEINKYQSSF